MVHFKLAAIAALLFILSGCTSWEEEHNEAMARASAHQWNKLIERHNTEPGASGPKWQMPNQQGQIYLDYLRQVAQQDADAMVDDATPGLGDCQLDEATESFVMHQRAPEEWARFLEQEAKILRRDHISKHVKVLSGICEDGRIEGPFAAIYSVHDRATSPDMAMEIQLQNRIDGHFRNGVLDGEVRVVSRDRSRIFGSWRDMHFYSIGVYENGKRVGTHANLSKTSGGQSIVVTQTLEQGRARVNAWMNEAPSTRYYLLDGVIDGWMEFASPVLKDSPLCYQAGQQISNPLYCQQVAAALEQLALVDPQHDHARLADLGAPKTIASPQVSAGKAAIEAGSDRDADPGSNGTWQAPRVGYYDWLNAFSDRKLAKTAAPIHLPRLQAVLRSDVSSALLPGSPLECELDSDMESYLLFQAAAGDHQSKRERQKQLGTQSEDSPAEIVITAGDCSSGRLEGAFTAYYRYQHRFSVPAATADFDIYGRVAGAFSNGRLHGELERVWLKERKSESFLPTEVSVSLAQFDNGDRQGGEVHLIAMPDLRATRLLLLETRPDGRERAETWQDGKPFVTSLLRDGVNDGFIKFFDPALRAMSNCYRDGVATKDQSYCRALGL